MFIHSHCFRSILRFVFIKINSSLQKIYAEKLILFTVEKDKQAENKEETETEAGTGGNSYTDQQLSEIIDVAFQTMDHNKDGYIDFAEYKQSG